MKISIFDLVFVGLFNIFLVVLLPERSLAQHRVEVHDTAEVDEIQSKEDDGSGKPPVGREAVRRHFVNETREEKTSGAYAVRNDHYLAIHVGGYLGSDEWKWGSVDHGTDVGQMTAGVTYRMGEWTNSMDLLFRGDFNSYNLVDGKALKLSLMPMISFPDATSRFPLYFAGGLGLGVYFQEIASYSQLSLDYQLVMGARVLNVIGSTGFFGEFGLKDHLNLLSAGQFNGTFLALGAVFAF